MNSQNETGSDRIFHVSVLAEGVLAAIIDGMDVTEDDAPTPRAMFQAVRLATAIEMWGRFSGMEPPHFEGDLEAFAAANKALVGAVIEDASHFAARDEDDFVTLTGTTPVRTVRGEDVAGSLTLLLALAEVTPL